MVLTFFKFWGVLGLNGYQDEISQIIFQFWGISKKIQYFQWFLINFDILGCIMTKWIQRLNFPNFPLILEDFCTKLKISKFSDIFWPFGLYNE